MSPCLLYTSSTGLRRAVSPPAISPIIHVGGMPNVGGISEADVYKRQGLRYVLLRLPGLRQTVVRRNGGDDPINWKR